MSSQAMTERARGGDRMGKDYTMPSANLSTSRALHSLACLGLLSLASADGCYNPKQVGELDGGSGTGNSAPQDGDDGAAESTTTSGAGGEADADAGVSEGSSSSGVDDAGDDDGPDTDGPGDGPLDPACRVSYENPECNPEQGPTGFDCSTFDDTCPTGTKCTPYAEGGGGAWNARRCAPIVADFDRVGEPCQVIGNGATGDDTCEPGSMCWEADAEGNGVCRAYCGCSQDTPSCGDGEVCLTANDGAINLCMPSCNPIGDDCGEGEGCYSRRRAGGGTEFACGPTLGGASVPELAGCSFVNQCAPGQTCVMRDLDDDGTPGCDGEPGCCSSFCDLTDPECGAGLECTPVFERGAPVCLDALGVCAEGQGAEHRTGLESCGLSDACPAVSVRTNLDSFDAPTDTCVLATLADAEARAGLGALRVRDLDAIGDTELHYNLYLGYGSDAVFRLDESRTMGAPDFTAKVAQRCQLKSPAFFADCIATPTADCWRATQWFESCVSEPPVCP